MLQRIKTILEKHEWIIPLGLFIVFMAFTLPGISWGAPKIWHPDEIVYISIRSLHTDIEFDSSNFNHPHLPIYAMLGLGKVILALGQTDREVLIAARVLSATLIGLTVVLAYYIPRRMGYNIYVSGISGLLLLANNEMVHNGHFAHNDTFVTFFSVLMIFLLVLYKTKGQRGWLYATFFSAGLAISSKYSAVSLVIIPILVYLYETRKSIVKRPLRVVETLFIGGILAYLGYSAGTPKALTWMAYTMKRVIPALLYNANYWVQPDSIRGVLGQYAVYMKGVGFPLFILSGLALVWGCYKVFTSWRSGTLNKNWDIAILLLAILVIDLPIMTSYNYPIRFFLPLMPLLAVLGALFISDMYRMTKNAGNALYPKLIGAGLTIIIILSIARVVSTMLLFINDSRIPGTEFVASLPLGTSLEHTFYEPTIPADHFEREHNYPLFFRKSPDQEFPTHKEYVYNAGEAGLDDRQTNYLIIDSFTSEKFDSPFTCAEMQVECDFFQQLETGESDHYKLLAEFKYSPPAFLPQLQLDFVNPAIRIYERIP
ncbi:MAG TPA: phospholipid carrier-dependent glycosyltransferase [Anaerolineales bacterium]|nr:phospholipid carrier-dependent glycosyltransferase [Anaerolineales bacterium]